MNDTSQYHNDSDQLDQTLRALFHDTLPKPRHNPWFTKKVLNRLPHKIYGQNRYFYIEFGTCLFAFMICMVLWVVLIHDYSPSAVTWRTFMHYIMLSFATVGIAAYICLRTVLRD